MRIVLAFILALATATLIGAAALSWFDQAAFLQAAGPDASLAFGDRLAWYGRTLYGLVVLNGTGLGIGLYPVLLAVGLLIGFGVAAIVKRAAPSLRFWWYAGAGAVALVTVIVALKLALGMMVVPGARTTAGLVGQGIAGLVAGMVFAAASARRRRPYSH